MKFNTKKIELAILLLFNTGILSAQKPQTFKLAGQQIELHGEFGEFEEEVVIEKIGEGLEIATISIKHQQGVKASPPAPYNTSYHKRWRGSTT